jgi:hypothetical protein
MKGGREGGGEDREDLGERAKEREEKRERIQEETGRKEG